MAQKYSLKAVLKSLDKRGNVNYHQIEPRYMIWRRSHLLTQSNYIDRKGQS